MSKFGETYTVKVVLALAVGDTVSDVVRQLQGAYDDGDLDGTFTVEQIGHVTIVTFERSIAEDIEVLEGIGKQMTEAAAVAQLAREFTYSIEQMRGETRYPTRVRDDLLAGECRVDNLINSFPKLSVEIEAFFQTGAAARLAEDYFRELVKNYFATDGHLLKVEIAASEGGET